LEVRTWTILKINLSILAILIIVAETFVAMALKKQLISSVAATAATK